MPYKYDEYLPVIITALVVLVLGCWNPKLLQSQHGGKPSGYPSYMWLSLIALAIGLLTVFLLSTRT